MKSAPNASKSTAPCEKKNSLKRSNHLSVLIKIRIPNRGIVLLEDLGNLTANELYDPKGAGVNTAEAVLYGVEILYKQCEHLIVVGNEVFSGGAEYADETDLYLKALAQIQNGIAAARITSAA